MTTNLKIWVLRANVTKYMSLVGYRWRDNKYIWTHFKAKHISSGDWVLPELEIVGKSKKLSDFVGGMLSVPIVSERAMEFLLPAVGEDVQFLPFHVLRGKPYYAMNVLRVEDYLDEHGSEGQTSASGKRFNFSTHVFKSDIPDDLPPIFKTRDDSLIFVTQPFIDVVVKNKLTGAFLVDPAENPIQMSALGRPLTIYPGLL